MVNLGECEMAIMADKLDFTGGLALHCDKPHRKNGRIFDPRNNGNDQF
jgi:hypothetical protein